MVAIVDSGATHHVCPDPSMFESFDPRRKAYISVADRKLKEPAVVGRFRPNNLHLVEGLYHPHIHKFLLSVDKLTEESGLEIIFRRGASEILDPDTGEKWKISKSEAGNLPSASLNFYEDASVRISVSEMVRGAKNDAEKLRVHERIGHLHVPGLAVKCPACDLAKAQGVSHAGERPPEHKPSRDNEQVDFDFTGLYDPDFWGNRWCLTAKDHYSKWSENFVCKQKSETGRCLRDFCNKHGPPARVRSDNAPEFKQPGSSWKVECARQTPKILPTFSAPYEPAENGSVERQNRVVQDNMRALLVGVDRRMWGYAAKTQAYTWNRLPRKTEVSPFEKKFGREPRVSHFRRFGCLAYAKKYVKVGKLDSRFRRGIFLGYGEENSTWLVGTWVDNKTTRTGKKFEVLETKCCKFDESILISDVDKLLSPGVMVTYPDPKTLCETVLDDPSVDPERPCKSRTGAPGDKRHRSSSEEADVGQSLEGGATANRDFLDTLLPENQPQRASFSSRNQEDEGSDGEVVQEGEVVKKKRGRPKGLTKQPHWAKPGPKPKKRRRRAAAKVVEGTEFLERHEQAFQARAELAENEEAVLFTVQYTWSQCMSGDDAVKRIEADTLERTQLEAAGCWRAATQEDFDSMGDRFEIVPSCCIYTKKRDGRYKARLVALGNRQYASLSGEIYSPTISHAGNRCLLVEAASQGWKIAQFDISNAFIRASLEDECVLLRLPKHNNWSQDQHKGDVVRFLRSLYELKISSRRWYDCYKKFLLSIGWVEAPQEPGLFKKRVGTDTLWLACYVDDNIIAGNNPSLVAQEQARILKHFPGKEIFPEYNRRGDEIRDL